MLSTWLLAAILMAPSQNPITRLLDDFYVLLHPADVAASEFTDGNDNDGGAAPGGQPDTIDESDDDVIPVQPISTKGPIQSSIVAPLRQQLIVYHTANVANLSIVITGELADPVSGERTLIGVGGRGVTFAVRSDRQIKIDTFEIPAGAILKTLSVSTAAGQSPAWGNCFVVVKRARVLDDGTTVDSEELISTYVTQFQPGTWPGGRLIASTDGPGLDQTITLADPGANALFTAVPLGAQWQILIAKGTNFTDGVAGNRSPQFIIFGLNFPAQAAASWQGPGSGFSISWAPSLLFSIDAFNGLATAPMMQDARLGPLAQIVFGTFQADAGDRWGNCLLRVREWLTFTQ